MYNSKHIGRPTNLIKNRLEFESNICRAELGEEAAMKRSHSRVFRHRPSAHGAINLQRGKK